VQYVAEIKVPLITQPNEYTCFPTCFKMLIDFLREKFPNIPNLSIQEIADIVRTDKDGTTLENIPNLNRTVFKNTPLEIIVTCQTARFEDIEKELDNGNPVIIGYDLALYQEEIRKFCGHAAIITRIDKDKLEVIMNDPLYGKRSMKLGKFMEVWDAAEKVFIQVKPKHQLQMEAFGDENDS